MMRMLALIILGAAAFGAAAQEPSLKAPPSAIAPAPAWPQEPGQEYYLVPTYIIERVNQVIEAQRREIERLRALAEKTVCI